MTDINSPIYQGPIVLDNSNIKITFDKQLKTNNNIDPNDFRVDISGVDKKINSVSVSNTSLILDLEDDVNSIANVTVTYIKNFYSIKNVTGEDDSTLNSFTTSAADIMPISVLTDNSGLKILMDLSDNLSTANNANIDKNKFSVVSSLGSLQDISYVSLTNTSNKVELGFSTSLLGGELYYLTYEKNSVTPANNVKTATNKTLQKLSNHPVNTKFVQLTPLTLASLVVDDNDPKQIVLKGNTGLNVNTLDKSSFSINVTTQSLFSKLNTVESIAHDKRPEKNRLLINLENNIAYEDIVNLSYSLPVDADKRIRSVNGTINSLETNLSVSLQQVGEVNRYVFNDGNSYNSNQKISLYTGQTYILKNVPQDHPIAVLNTGKTGKITYSGDNAKKSSKAVIDSSANDTYDFFYGDVSINVLDDFGEVSVYGFNDGYMGGKDLFEHRDLPLLNDASVNIINSGGNKYVFNDLQTYTTNEKFALKNGTYILRDVSASHPIAVLNSGKEANIFYKPLGATARQQTITIKVSGGAIAAPHYTFTVDGSGIDISTYELIPGNIYNFESDNISGPHPFYVSDQGYKQASQTVTMTGVGTHQNGIVGTGSVATMTIPANFTGNLYYFCTAHNSMYAQFQVADYPVYDSSFNRVVSSSTADGTYYFYHGDVEVTVSGDFGQVSVWCYYHGYMGGENIFVYDNKDYATNNVDLSNNADLNVIQTDLGTLSYNIDGVNKKSLNLVKSDSYVFDLSDTDLSGYQFSIGLTADAGVAYTDGVDISGTPGHPGAYLKLTVQESAPQTLYYFGNLAAMGGTMAISTVLLYSDMASFSNSSVSNLVGPPIPQFPPSKGPIETSTNLVVSKSFNGAANNRTYGYSVDICGNYAVSSNMNVNSVNIIKYSSNTWGEQNQIVDQSGVRFGFNVLMQDDLLLISDHKRQSNKGRVNVYSLSGENFVLRNGTNATNGYIEGELENDLFGYAMDYDSDKLIVSAIDKNVNSKLKNGKVYIYKQTGNNWALEHNLVGEHDDGSFGNDVTIHKNYAAVSYKKDPSGNEKGSVRIFKYDSSWSANDSNTTLVGTSDTGRFGHSISMHDDGSRVTLLIGAPGENKVYLYTHNTDNNWSLLAYFTGQDNVNFGHKVVNMGDKIYISAIDASNKGKVFVFKDRTSHWEKQHVFIGDHLDEKFGFSMATTSNNLIVGSPYKGINAGETNIYSLDPSNNTLLFSFTEDLSYNSQVDNLEFDLQVDSETRTVYSAVVDTSGNLKLSYSGADAVQLSSVALKYRKQTDLNTHLYDKYGNTIVDFTYPDISAVNLADSGITSSTLIANAENLVPNNITRDSNGYYYIKDLQYSVKNVNDDSDGKKRNRTKHFVKEMLNRIKTIDTNLNLRTEGIMVDSELLAFSDSFKRSVRPKMRIFQSDSSVSLPSIPADETIYIPLEPYENAKINFGVTEYTFTYQQGKTIVSPAIDGLTEYPDGAKVSYLGYTFMFGSLMVSENPLVIHIPVLFDISGLMATVYGEDVSGQIYTPDYVFNTHTNRAPSLTAATLKQGLFYADEVDSFNVKISANNQFIINNEATKVLRLQRGKHYRFDVSDPSMNGHKLSFSASKNGTWNTDVSGTQLTTGFKRVGIEGNSGAFVEYIVPTAGVPNVIFYYDSENQGVGDYGVGGLARISDGSTLFYKGVDASMNAIANQIHNELCNESTAKMVHDVSYAKVKMKYGNEYIAPISHTMGNSIGELLLRFVATHLSGHPLGQAFIQNDESIVASVNGRTAGTANLGTTLVGKLTKNIPDLSYNVPEFSTTPRLTNGGANSVLQSIYEQMLVAGMDRFVDLDDVDVVRPLPFKSGDTLVLYLDVKANLQNGAANTLNQVLLSSVFPNTDYSYLNADSTQLNAGIWKIELTMN
jgi:hypothetical protein